MNYTTTKQSVIFELPLADFFGRGVKYRNGEQIKYSINSIQEWEEDCWNNFESFSPYMDLETDGRYYNLIDAEKWLIEKGYTQAEIDLFRDTLESDQLRALADAKDSSYQAEYSNELYKKIQEDADELLADNLTMPYKLLDNITTEDFKRNKTDQEFIRFEITKDDIKKAIKENGETPLVEKADYEDGTYIDIFHDYFLYFSIKETNREYIDYYGTMGNCDDWLDCFKDYNEITGEIDRYRIDEADKIDNAERASLELKEKFDDINRYSAKYFTKHETREKIARQVTALKSVIKNAV